MNGNNGLLLTPPVRWRSVYSLDVSALALGADDEVTGVAGFSDAGSGLLHRLELARLRRMVGKAGV
jgi:hypothetical protein